MPQNIEPYDPDTEEGRQIAKNLSRVIAEIELAIMARRALATATPVDPAEVREAA